ncbi:MAG: hypothetical protein QXH27_00395 [Candidatus Micrarchaeia archaeon]
MKTTLILRDDLYAFLVNAFGKRGISRAVNEILFEHLFREKKKDMFGADPWLKKAGLKDIRDERDRHF